ncbi:MAG: hypothetical protein R6U86_01660 [Bacteroidales bacterium]
MNQQETTEHIVQLLENIVERAHYINKHPEKELCLELDLIMEDLRWLYRAYATVKKDCLASEPLSGQATAPHAEPSAEPPIEKSVEPAVRPTPAQEVPADSPPGDQPPSDGPRSQVTPPEAPMDLPTNQVPPQKEKAGPEAPKDLPTNQVPPQQEKIGPEAPMDPPTNQVPPQKEKAGPEAPAESTSQRQAGPEGNQRKSIIDLFSHSSGAIGEQFSSDDNSLHQRISSHKEDRSISARMQQHPIANIKDAIGVNEKFLFINELFSGNIQAYHEAISALNSMDSLGAAFDHLNRLTKELNWDAKRSAATIEKLAGFVQRRYMDK